jgi:hypothetical protein
LTVLDAVLGPHAESKKLLLDEEVEGRVYLVFIDGRLLCGEA